MGFSPELIKGSVTPVILALLRDRAMYGYEMVKLVDARTGGKLKWREGTLYPALHKLESDGLIRSRWSAESGARARKYYSITPRGKKELARQSDQWEEFSGAISRLMTEGGKP